MDRLDDTPFADQQSTQANAAELIRLYQEARTAHRRSSFLAEASTILSSSLDYAARLSGLARFVVPYLADWCVIDMIDDEDQVVRRLAIAHADPTKQDMARRFQQKFSVLDRQAVHTINAVLDNGQTWCDFDVSEERFVAQARDAEHLQLLRELGFASEIVVPIIVRGRPAGTLTLARGASSPHYTSDDVALAEEIARRAAVAVDQARLYYEARQARQAAERAAERTNRLQAITAALSETLTPQQVAEVILTQMIGTVGAVAGFIGLLADNDSILELIAFTGYPPEVMQPWRRIPLDTPVMITDAVRRGVPIWIQSEAERRAAYPMLYETVNGVGSETSASLPLIIKDRIIGAIGINFLGARLISEEDRSLLQAIAQQCAQALERARLYEAERRAVERANRLQAVTTALSGALTSSQIVDVIVRHGAAALGAVSGTIAVLIDGGATLQIIPTESYPKDEADALAAWATFPANAPVPMVEVTQTGTPVWIESPEDWISRYPHLAGELEKVEHRAWAIAPLTLNEQIAGTLGFAFATARVFSDEDRALVVTLAQQCAQALERARLYEAERRAREAIQTAEQRLAFLAEASYVLNASLDYQTTLDQLARLVLPILADYCAIDVITDEGEVRRIATAHRNPDKAALMDEMLTYPPPVDRAQGSVAALRTGQTIVVPEISDELLVAVSYNEAHLRMMRNLQPHSSVGVPIIARGRTLGSIMLVMSESGRAYRPEDVALAEEVARRAGIAIDNALLYQQAQDEIKRREQVEADLRSQQTQLRLITDALPMLVSYIGDDQRYRFNNQAYANWFGYQPPELIGRRMRDIIGETAYQTALPHIQTVLSGRETHFENILPRRDGGVHHVDIAFIPHTDAADRVLGFFVVGMDITDQKKAEEDAAHRIRQLLVLNRVLQAALEPAQLNETLDILLQEICDIFQVDAADIHFVNHTGQMLSLMAHRGYTIPADQLAEDIPLDDSVRGHAVRQRQVVQHTGNASGGTPPTAYHHPQDFGSLAVTPLWVRETIIGTLAIYSPAKRELSVEEVALLEALGRSIGVTIENARLYTEVQLLAETLQRKVEERTEELQIALLRAQSADNAKSVMISTVSHEMRTPLSSIIGFSNLVLSRKPDQVKVLDYVTAINVEARRLADLVNDFLDLQRIEAGREVFRFTELDLGNLIRDVVSKQVLGDNSPHRLTLDIKPVPPVYADPNRIRQVVINLLSNAIKYSPNGGEIVLTLDQRAEAVVFSIRDQGLGIPADELGQIFDVFHRGRVAERQRIRGTGLGLALSRRIISSHNGQIWVESAGSNQGSTFSFSLPLSGRATAAANNPAQADGRQIVIIEDDQNFATYLAERLKPEGFAVHLLRFESATPEILAHIAPSLIVLDILQGDQKPGWRLLTVFKQHPATRIIPVIVCSALNDSGEAIAMGAAAHITKPVDETALLREINRLIGQAKPLSAGAESGNP